MAKKITVCGWCAGAPVSTEPERAHTRCYSTDELPCACRMAGHVATTEVAKVQAAYCHTTLQEINRRA